MTPTEFAAMQRARGAVQSIDDALAQAKLTQRTQTLKAQIDRVELQLAVAKAGRFLRAGPRR